jgi:hypothetical protein
MKRKRDRKLTPCVSMVTQQLVSSRPPTVDELAQAAIDFEGLFRVLTVFLNLAKWINFICEKEEKDERIIPPIDILYRDVYRAICVALESGKVELLGDWLAEIDRIRGATTPTWPYIEKEIIKGNA